MAGKERGDPQEDPTGDEGGQTCPAQHHTRSHGQVDPMDHQGQERAQRRLPQAGAGVEVGPGLVRTGDPHRVGQRDREHHGGRGQEGAAQRYAGPDGDQCDQSEQERPQQVGLPLDGQRPEVLNGAGGGLPGQIVHGRAGQCPVLVVERGGTHLGEDVGPAWTRQPQTGGDHDGGEHDGRGRGEPAREPGPEGEEVDPTVALQGAEQGSGDEEPGEQQEHVHATGDPAEPDVVNGHQHDGDGTQPLDLGAEGHGGGRRGRAGGHPRGEDRHEW